MSDSPLAAARDVAQDLQHLREIDAEAHDEFLAARAQLGDGDTTTPGGGGARPSGGGGPGGHAGTAAKGGRGSAAGGGGSGGAGQVNGGLEDIGGSMSRDEEAAWRSQLARRRWRTAIRRVMNRESADDIAAFQRVMLDLQSSTGETLDQLVDSFLEHDRAAYNLVLANNQTQAAISSELEELRALTDEIAEARRSTSSLDADVVKRKKMQKGRRRRPTHAMPPPPVCFWTS